MINELKIGSDRRKLVARMETEATQTRGPGCEELWFDDWKWFKVYRGEPELIEREVPFHVAWDFFLDNRHRDDAQKFHSNWIDELAFCRTFQELPLIFTVPTDITFHPAGWRLIESDEYGQGYEYIEGTPTWTYSSFVFSKDGAYIEIKQGIHWEAPGPCGPTIQKLNPREVARRLEVRGKQLPDELKGFSSFKLLTPDNLGELLAEEQNPNLDLWQTESPEDSSKPVVGVPGTVRNPSDYPAGLDGHRRDRRIYELASNRFTNGKIVAMIEEESPVQKWEPIVETTVSECLKRISLFDQLNLIVRPGGRPRAAKPQEPQKPQAKT